MAAGDFVLAQAQAEGYGIPHGQAGEITADDSLIPSTRPCSGFDLNRPWAAPGERRADENLGLEVPKPAGPAEPPGVTADAPAPAAAPKSGVTEAKQRIQVLAPKPAPEAIRKQMLDRLFD
ncbi:MAG: hypothetical protein ACRECZ_09685, partial [Methylocella sp.]